ncbi:MAG TPA: vitamin K epoxide reductase family protein [Gaiellaceae bacterium]|nr:vitamin K epoxide reductase family protein [Gaiellaceae bacterium]
MTDRTLRLAVAAVAAAGTGVAAYLTWVHYHPEALVCTRGGGCETVQRSGYAVLLGVPVAVYGLVAWSAVLALVAWDAPAARVAVAAIALVAVVFAAYLVVLQLAVIDAVCVWCMVNDAGLVPALAVLGWLRARPAVDVARAGPEA